MIEVSLEKGTGLRVVTQYFHGCGDIEEMLIPECARCVGMFIFWKRKSEAPRQLFLEQFAISAVHIAPFSRAERMGRRIFFRHLKKIAVHYEPKELFYAGRKTNTVQNNFHSENTKRFFLSPLFRMFPHMIYQGNDPLVYNGYTDLCLSETGDVIWEEFRYC